ncbi:MULTISPECIES: hypothetical protein [unclassified Francisella]|uniref:hypothetical protein n=1 Tax=unclassified Francisella TaxID=2610885 RepID=UPI002E30FCB3|nr:MULTISPECIES: hypothetical protein [unclassified Francisella]MED7820392.1 hypothetical protein [Francisella sp. 19S2-4]MED7831224.1 hypothetical protein [Francisella sp. 19S2-10]
MPKTNNALFCNKEFVESAIKNREKFHIVDARSESRFSGSEPEPRKNLRSGHILNSINLPYQKLIRNGKYIEISEIENIFTRFYAQKI